LHNAAVRYYVSITYEGFVAGESEVRDLDHHLLALCWSRRQHQIRRLQIACSFVALSEASTAHTTLLEKLPSKHCTQSRACLVKSTTFLLVFEYNRLSGDFGGFLTVDDRLAVLVVLRQEHRVQVFHPSGHVMRRLRETARVSFIFLMLNDDLPRQARDKHAILRDFSLKTIILPR
jgi:hypothetical protein